MTRKQSLKSINDKIDKMIIAGTDKTNRKKYLELCETQYIIWKAGQRKEVGVWKRK